MNEKTYTLIDNETNRILYDDFKLTFKIIFFILSLKPRHTLS